MNANNTLWVTVIVLLVVGTSSLLAVELSTVSAASTDDIYLSNSGSVDLLIPGDSTHDISNIVIDTPGPGFDDELVLLSIDLSVIQSQGVDTSSARVMSVSNASLESQKTYESSDGNRSLHIVVSRTGTESSIYIDQLIIGGLSSTNATAGSDLQYPIEVSSHHTRPPSEPLSNAAEYNLTGQFTIAGGSIVFRDQATGSSDSTSDRPSMPGITFDRIRSNINSTIVIGYNGNNTRIAGLKSFSADELDGQHQVSIPIRNLDRFPGPQTAYLLPRQKINENSHSPGDIFPDNIKQNAIASNTRDVYFSQIEFTDAEYNTSHVNEFRVQTARLDDGNRNTSYILTIHPLNQDGNILKSKYIGSSDVLSGYNEDVRINLSDGFGHNNHISQSNRYTVTVRLIDDHVENNSVSYENTSILPNSDIGRGFVPNGVSDSAIISVSAPHPEKVASSHTFDDSSEYDGNVIYDTGSLALNITNQLNTIEAYKILNSTHSELVGIGSHSAESSYVTYNTTQFKNGEYYFSSPAHEANHSFTFVNRSSVYSDVLLLNSHYTAGNIINFNITADSNTTSLTLSHANATGTLATATVVTPRSEPTPIGINTYALGDPSLAGELLSVSPSTTVTSVSTTLVNESLPSGEYVLTATANPGNATETVTMTLENRATSNLSVYSTSREPETLDSPTAIAEARSNGTLTPATTVTDNDTVVYSVESTGLGGYEAIQPGSLETGADLDGISGLNFTVWTAHDVSANRSVWTTATGSRVVTHSNGLYLVSNVSDTLGSSTVTHTDKAGISLTPTFSVTDDRLRELSAVGESGVETVSAPLWYEPSTSDAEMTNASSSPSNTTATDGNTTDSSGSNETQPTDPDDTGEKTDSTSDTSTTTNGDTEGRTSGGGSGGSGTTDGGSSETGGDDGADEADTGGGDGGGGGDGSTESGGTGGSGATDGGTDGDTGGEADGGGGSGGGSGGGDDGRRVDESKNVSTGDNEEALTASGRPGVQSVLTARHPPAADTSTRPEPDQQQSEAVTERSSAPSEAADSSAARGGSQSQELKGAGRSDELPGFEDAPLRRTAYDVSGFGVVSAVIALLVVAGVMARIRVT